MKFESIDAQHERAKVIGGWLVKAYENVYHRGDVYSPSGDGWDWRVAMTFVPDPHHAWEVDEYEMDEE